MVFQDYAHYYDLLYKDKNYRAEADYIDHLIKEYNVDATSILDLGCGTGKHAALLNEKGYRVHGVDLSAEMLKEAQGRSKNTVNLTFSQSDIQSFQLEETFDVVTALFHVISYQQTDQAIMNVFKNVQQHLKPGGIFIFDCWYGPAVLYEKPEVRVKRFENDHVKVTRIAEPVLLENENIVKVNYDVFIQDKREEKFQEVKEVHTMHYLFKNEILHMLNKNGLNHIEHFAFLTGEPLSKNTWGACFVAKNNKLTVKETV